MLLTALSRKSHRCGIRTSDTVPAFHMPVSFSGQEIMPWRKWKQGIWSHPKIPIPWRQWLTSSIRGTSCRARFIRCEHDYIVSKRAFGSRCHSSLVRDLDQAYKTQAHLTQSQPGAAGTWSLQLGKAPQAQLTHIQPAWEAARLLNLDRCIYLDGNQWYKTWYRIDGGEVIIYKHLQDVTCSQPFPYTLYSPILSLHTCTSNKMSVLDHLCMSPRTKNTSCHVLPLSLEFFLRATQNPVLDRSHIC